MGVREQFSESFIEVYQDECQRKSVGEEIPQDMLEAGITDPSNLQMLVSEIRRERPDLFVRMAVQIIPKTIELQAGNSLVEMLEDWRDRSERLERLDPYAIPGEARRIEATESLPDPESPKNGSGSSPVHPEHDPVLGETPD